MKTILKQLFFAYFSIFAMITAADINQYVKIASGPKKRQSTKNILSFYQKLSSCPEHQKWALDKRAEQLKEIAEKIEKKKLAFYRKKRDEEYLETITLKRHFLQFFPQIPLQNTIEKQDHVQESFGFLTKTDIPLDSLNAEQK